MVTAAPAAMGPSPLPPAPAQPRCTCTAPQRAQAEGAAGKQVTLWHLKSSGRLRKGRESKANYLAIALKAATSSATLIHSAASPVPQTAKMSASSQIIPYSSVL